MSNRGKIYVVQGINAGFTIRELAEDFAAETKIKYFKDNQFAICHFCWKYGRPIDTLNKYKINDNKPLYEQIKNLGMEEAKEILDLIYFTSYDVFEVELYA